MKFILLQIAKCQYYYKEMRFRTILTIFLLTIILASCSGRRIDLIEESFQIAIPKGYKIIKNSTESSGFAGADFEINLQLQFNSRSFEDLEQELNKIERLKDGSRYYKESENGEISILIVDNQKKQLHFQFIHL